MENLRSEITVESSDGAWIVKVDGWEGARYSTEEGAERVAEQLRQAEDRRPVIDDQRYGYAPINFPQPLGTFEVKPCNFESITGGKVVHRY